MSKAQKNRLPLAEALAGVLPKGKFWEKAWSLVEGCTPCSPGCDNCWLASLERCYGAKVVKGATGNFNDRTITGFEKHIPSPLVSGGKFNGKIRCREDRLDIPLKRQKPTVYAIWSDLMHKDVPDSFRDQAFAAMAQAPQHWFIIVTKRPEVAARYFTAGKDSGCSRQGAIQTQMDAHYARTCPPEKFGKTGRSIFGRDVTYPLCNVVILVTMEDQERANKRAPYALQLAGQGWTVGALCEPLLGSVDLDRIHESWDEEGGSHCESWESCLNGRRFDPWSDGWVDGMPKLSWVITGGETGHNARPAHPDWFKSLRDQAQAAGVPFMFKGWGEWVPDSQNPDISGPSGATQATKVGKKVAGRLLDGVEYLEVPNV